MAGIQLYIRRLAPHLFAGNHFMTFSNAEDVAFPTPDVQRAKNLFHGPNINLPEDAHIGSEDHIISENPRFVNSSNPAGADETWRTAADGFRLFPGSPAIGQGNPFFLPPDEFDLNFNGDTEEPLPVDMAGFPRIPEPLSPRTRTSGSAAPHVAVKPVNRRQCAGGPQAFRAVSSFKSRLTSQRH